MRSEAEIRAAADVFGESIDTLEKAGLHSTSSVLSAAIQSVLLWAAGDDQEQFDAILQIVKLGSDLLRDLQENKPAKDTALEYRSLPVSDDAFRKFLQNG